MISIPRPVICCAVLGISACAPSSWQVPEGAPAEIVRSCKAEAEQSQSLSSDNLQRQQQQRDNVPGSADDLIQEVKEAKQSAKSGQPPGDVLFYKCLESNGMELEPAQRAVIDEWSAR